MDSVQVIDNAAIKQAKIELAATCRWAARLGVRPVSQPYIACGQEVVQWQTANPASLASGLASPILPFRLTAVVDTSAAAFATIPCYTARIAGERLLTVNVGGTSEQVLVEPVIDLGGATPTSFVLAAALVAVPPLEGLTIDTFGGIAGFNGWKVAWMGVE